MQNLTCIVVDDEPLARSLITSYVGKTPFLSLVASCSNAADAMEALDTYHPDIAFLDIEMPGMSGMELARFVTPATRIIFITAYERYAIEGIKVSALDYLLKPVSYDEFLEAAQRALNAANNGGAPQPVAAAPHDTVAKTHIIVRSDYKLVQIPLADILFIEGVKDYVKIYTREAIDNPTMSLMSLKSLEDKLPDSFLRVHRSFIVNTDNIRTIERGSRIVFGKHYVPVGDTYRSAFSAYLAARSILPD